MEPNDCLHIPEAWRSIIHLNRLFRWSQISQRLAGDTHSAINVWFWLPKLRGDKQWHIEWISVQFYITEILYMLVSISTWCFVDTHMQWQLESLRFASIYFKVHLQIWLIWLTAPLGVCVYAGKFTLAAFADISQYVAHCSLFIHRIEELNWTHGRPCAVFSSGPIIVPVAQQIYRITHQPQGSCFFPQNDPFYLLQCYCHRKYMYPSFISSSPLLVNDPPIADSKDHT